MPIEVLLPSDPSDDDCVEAFSASLLSICLARNNNVQLTLETKAGKKGFYEDLRKALPPTIAERVEWKTNDGGQIKVRDLIALAWIPLSKLDFDYIPKVAPQNTYRSKGDCAKLFDELLSDDRVSKPTDGEYTRMVHNKHVKAALKIAGAIPKLLRPDLSRLPQCVQSMRRKVWANQLREDGGQHAYAANNAFHQSEIAVLLSRRIDHAVGVWIEIVAQG